VDAERVIQYDANGSYQQTFPGWNNDPWRCADDNGHFCYPTGIAFDNFDSKDWMYVADRDNQRVQVFNITSGTPVYSATIGVTGQRGSDNAHFDEPQQLAVDSSNNLYVADRQNYRIQKCSYSMGWSCTTFHGTGINGDGANQLGHVEGLGIFGSTLYIADSSNDRVKKCSVPSGPCSIFTTNVPYPTDAAAISASRILVTLDPKFTVHEYNGSGSDQGIFAGVEDVPYKTDNKRLNRPWGIAVGKDGSLYVSEYHGNRLVKLDPSGSQVNAAWPVGEAGIWGQDNEHLDGPQGNLAVDANGQILVPDTWNQRVQVFDPDGNHKHTLGTTGEKGGDKFHFDEPMGVAVSPLNGDIYVADSWNQRVQVFKSNYQWKATIGQTGNPGTGNNQFNQPHGVFVDKNGDIYVADRQNHRVQVFDKNRTYKATLGVTGECDREFGNMCSPQTVIVDNLGRIFVSEEWENRVQVFDDKYRYLTTVGGSWGSSNGDFREPGGLALDQMGNLYVADSGNHRVQKFAPGVFGWQQTNLDGFGEIDNFFITTIKTLNSSLVAGTFNSSEGCQLWKLDNGAWTSLMKGGFGHKYNVGISNLIDFKGKHYASTSANQTDGAEIWRGSSLTNWSRVVKDGFGNPDHAEINSLAVFKDMLYAGTWNWSGTKGGEIWRTASGNSGDWTRVVSNGFGNSENEAVLFLVTYKDMLYASTVNFVTGGEVWRSGNGKSWNKVSSSGFGDQYNGRIFLVPDTSTMYAGTWNYKDSDNPGGELWRCSKCDGSDWVEVPNTKGFGSSENRSIFPVEVPGNSLYAFTENRSTGLQVWMAEDGENFRKVSPDGFGDSKNYFPTGIALYNKKLYVGTGNWFANAGEIWMRKGFYFLPTIFKK
jgi:streptogramin lyase